MQTAQALDVSQTTTLRVLSDPDSHRSNITETCVKSCNVGRRNTEFSGILFNKPNSCDIRNIVQSSVAIWKENFLEHC